MNIICLIGIQQFLYLYSIHTYENYIALLIYVNGVICHSFIKTKYGLCISYYDILINFDEENRVVISDLSNSFNSYAKMLNIRHRHWSVQMFCGHFRKLVPNVDVRRRGSTKREYQFPSLNECKMYFREKYSLGSDLFEIN